MTSWLCRIVPLRCLIWERCGCFCQRGGECRPQGFPGPCPARRGPRSGSRRRGSECGRLGVSEPRRVPRQRPCRAGCGRGCEQRSCSQGRQLLGTAPSRAVLPAARGTLLLPAGVRFGMVTAGKAQIKPERPEPSDPLPSPAGPAVSSGLGPPQRGSCPHPNSQSLPESACGVPGWAGPWVGSFPCPPNITSRVGHQKSPAGLGAHRKSKCCVSSVEIAG